MSYTRALPSRLAAVPISTYAWQADVDTTVVIPVLSLLYLFAVGRFGASRARVLCFAAAMALLAVAFWTPLHHLGLHYLLSAHLLQNVILAEWAPLLAVLGLSTAMAERARAPARLACRRSPGGRVADLARELLRVARAAGLRRCARAPGVADPHRARVLLRDRFADVVAARPRRAAAARLGRARGAMRSRRSSSLRRSGCCSRCCQGRSTTSTSHVPTRVWGLSRWPTRSSAV